TVITATVAVLAGAGIYEARQASRLRQQVQTLQHQQAPLSGQIQQLQSERDVAKMRLTALTDEAVQIKNNTAELLRLRGRAGSLRQAEQENIKLSKQLEALSQQLLATESDAAVTRSNRTQSLLKIKKDLASELGLSVQVFWAHHQRRMPATIAEALAYSDLKWETRAVAESNGISANQFEMLGNEIPEVSENLRILMLREKEPVSQYDGTWIRFYVDSTASVEIPVSTNGDFTVWERENWSKRIPH
ncbi:MAG: hypothetical protein QOD03_1720, partial [Verrucomicrobiota bacterium]